MTPGAAGDQLDGRLFTCFTHHVRPYPRAASLPPSGQHSPLPPSSLLYSSSAPSCSTPDPPTGTHTSRQTARPPLQFTISLQTPTNPLPPTLCSSRKPGTLQSTSRRQCVRASVASVASRGAGPSCLDFSFRPVILVQSRLVFTRSRQLTQHTREA